eukprot:CAMPEP_0116572566 /NCGR_PEP_ID=MMETSP0397-20121206/18250_1 /TAXON_ID=216820 /ORGANISM="Cyclophora tenuis, Strain ECT3854" /LENGTH=354 /DNA_ID=CAMNT_0004100915 /DNA_START=390 /DNA_END=1454 /DNA_ORIENTATION=+
MRGAAGASSSGTQSPVVDPTLLLSIYLLSYPMLQWSVGGWLLTPEQEDASSTTTQPPPLEMEDPNNNSNSDNNENSSSNDTSHPHEESLSAIPMLPLSDPLLPPSLIAPPTQLSDAEQPALEPETRSNTSSDTDKSSSLLRYCWDVLVKIVRRCLLQPPVVAAIIGFVVATFPKLRGIFVDIVDRDDDAPTQWFFDALYTIGQAAVPINMILLGSNLSQSFQKGRAGNDNDARGKSVLLSKHTMAAVVLGKLVLMPLIGVGSVVLFTLFVWNLPMNVHASFCLVTMMAFLTPTANNVMVMVELSGGNREGIARVIAWQYLAAPLVLSLTVSLAVGVANASLSWHDHSGNSSPTL